MMRKPFYSFRLFFLSVVHEPRPPPHSAKRGPPRRAWTISPHRASRAKPLLTNQQKSNPKPPPVFPRVLAGTGKAGLGGRHRDANLLDFSLYSWTCRLYMRLQIPPFPLAPSPAPPLSSLSLQPKSAPSFVSSLSSLRRAIPLLTAEAARACRGGCCFWCADFPQSFPSPERPSEPFKELWERPWRSTGICMPWSGAAQPPPPPPQPPHHGQQSIASSPLLALRSLHWEGQIRSPSRPEEACFWRSSTSFTSPSCPRTSLCFRMATTPSHLLLLLKAGRARRVLI